VLPRQDEVVVNVLMLLDLPDNDLIQSDHATFVENKIAFPDISGDWLMREHQR